MPCGSGNKAKRCCHGPHKFVDIRVCPLDLCQDVINDLVGTNETEMRSLFDRLLYLPELDSSLQVRCPASSRPTWTRRSLPSGQVDEGFDRALEQVVPTLDTLDNRIRLTARRRRAPGPRPYPGRARCRRGPGAGPPRIDAVPVLRS